MSARITIADVAREAQVSTQTVSRAINNKSEIRPETRQHVLAVADRLGYLPNSLARALATDRTGTLGIVVPDVANPYFAEVIRGAEDAALPHDYTIFLCNTNEDPKREGKLLGLLESKRVDGLILCSPTLPSRQLAPLLARQRATVLVGRPALANSVGAIWVNNRRGIELGVEHLLACGRRQIGLLYGLPATFSRRQRQQAFIAAVKAAGLSPEPTLMEGCAPQMEDGYQAALTLLRRRPTLDAIICHNDLVAVGALQACAALNRPAPEGVAIIGFDNIALAHLVRPTLTTVHYPIPQLGAQAVTLLLEAIKRGSNGTPQELCAEPTLIVRESTPQRDVLPMPD